MPTFTIVGASLAGLSAAATLRDRGHDDPIVVVDPSPQLPADHPPLSKQVLSGEWEPARAVQPLADRVPELDLDLRLGTAATALDAATRTLQLSDGTTLCWRGGRQPSVPVGVAFTQLSAGLGQTCGLKADGTEFMQFRRAILTAMRGHGVADKANY